MITKTVNKIARDIDGKANLSDDELLALVKKAYRKTAKICSRGCWGYNKHYASASGAIWRAYGHGMLTDLGYSQEWQDGFAEGFEYTGSRWDWDLYEATDGKEHNTLVPEPRGGADFNTGFEKGKWIADQVFHHWPDSPDIYSVPEDSK